MPSNAHQIRASHAMLYGPTAKAKADEPNAVAGYPNLILRGGLMSTLAYSLEKTREGNDRRPAFRRVADAIAQHLAATPTGENLLTPNSASGAGLLQKLKDSDSTHLRLCTSEALEFLSYLKRFAK